MVNSCIVACRQSSMLSCEARIGRGLDYRQ